MKRREFVAAAASAPLVAKSKDKLAMLGGEPACKVAWNAWPKWDKVDEKGLLDVLNSGKWGRMGGKAVDKFEADYASLLGAKFVLATANGTSALFTSLNGIGVQPGDEVIVPPYTFVATINVVLLQYALPVFADTDIDSFQVDPATIERKITERTTAIVPVHMAGCAADLDRVLAIGKRHKIPVIEDACQAHLGEWKGKRLGSMGTTGCFSFQASKNLNSGEGGAVATNDEAVYDRCFAFHGNGRTRRHMSETYNFGGANLRLTEFQGSILNSQMTRILAQADVRHENAKYLTSLLSKIPGIHPVRNYDGCTRSAWHLFMLRYDKQAFAGVSRAAFLKALAAEGVRASGGYTPLNKQPFIATTIKSRAYQRLYPEKVLREWADANQCPKNDALCEQAVWFTQNMLLGPRTDMEQIAEAVAKVQARAGELRNV